MSAKTQWSTGRWLILVMAVASMLLTASLGFWQLRRAAYKTTLAEAIERQKSLPAAESIAQLAIKNVANPWAQAVHRPVALRGRWLHEYTVFLDNRPMQLQGGQRVGFYVATPLQLQESNQIIWVQRGWVARDFQDRGKLPLLLPSSAEVVVKGRVIEKISQAYAMDEAASRASPSWTTLAPDSPLRIWQNLPTIAFVSGLLPIAVVQTESDSAPDALLRSWPAADTGVAKHHGYAFQWFALSSLILILYVWFQLIAPSRERRRRAAQD